MNNNNNSIVLPEKVMNFIIATYEKELQWTNERIESMSYQTIPFNKYMEHNNSIALLVAEKNEKEKYLEICKQYTDSYYPPTKD